MDFLLFHVFLLPGTNILRWEWEELQANIAYFFYNFLRCVLCASSCVSNRLSPARLWPRPWNRTPVWRTWIWSATRSALKGLRLGVWCGWCHEGRGCEEIAEEGSRHSCLKVRSGEWWKAMQCRFAIHFNWRASFNDGWQKFGAQSQLLQHKQQIRSPVYHWKWECSAALNLYKKVMKLEEWDRDVKETRFSIRNRVRVSQDMDSVGTRVCAKDNLR